MNSSTRPDPQGRSSLHAAAVAGDHAAVQRQLLAGEDVAAVDVSGATPLHLACQQNNLRVARLLLAAKAAVDVRDAYGNTPLWRAIFAFQGGEPELIRLLLDAGADPDLKNASGRSPRDMAMTSRRPDVENLFR